MLIKPHSDAVPKLHHDVVEMIVSHNYHTLNKDPILQHPPLKHWDWRNTEEARKERARKERALEGGEEKIKENLEKIAREIEEEKNRKKQNNEREAADRRRPGPSRS